MKLRAILAFAKGKATIPLALGSAAWLFWHWMNEPKEPVIIVSQVMPSLAEDIMFGDMRPGDAIPPFIPAKPFDYTQGRGWFWVWYPDIEALKIRNIIKNMESCARCHSSHHSGVPSIESSFYL
jgi:hypothetical protein